MRWPAWTSLGLLELLAVVLPEFRHLWRDNNLAVPLFTITLKVLPVVFFRGVECAEGRDFSHNRGVPDLLCVDLPDDLFSSVSLRGSVVKDRGPVLRALVGS